VENLIKGVGQQISYAYQLKRSWWRFWLPREAKLISPHKYEAQLTLPHGYVKARRMGTIVSKSSVGLERFIQGGQHSGA